MSLCWTYFSLFNMGVYYLSLNIKNTNLEFPWDLFHFSPFSFYRTAETFTPSLAEWSDDLLRDNRITVWLFKPQNLYNFHECRWPKNTSGGFQCSHQILLSRHPFHEATISKMLWPLISAARSNDSMGHIAAKTWLVPNFGDFGGFSEKIFT